MGILDDVRRGAKAVAKEAETRTQLAMKHAEAANLRTAIEEALAECGREVYNRWDATGDAEPLLTDRAKSLLSEVRRLEGERARLDGEMSALRKESVFTKTKEGEAHGASSP